MWACGVVVIAEFVEELLQFSNGMGGWSCGEPFFKGLVESLNFSLGLRVSWPSVFERVKLFVCGARFIGICRSGRERPRPFG